MGGTPMLRGERCTLEGWEVRLELTPFRIHSPALCPLSYNHHRILKEHGRNRTCVGRLCKPLPRRSATCSASVTAPRVGIEPPTSRFGAGRSSTDELPARLVVTDSQRGRIRTFDPVL